LFRILIKFAVEVVVLPIVTMLAAVPTSNAGPPDPIANLAFVAVVDWIPAEFMITVLAVMDVAVATPREGVVRVGEVASTALPVPVVPTKVSTIDPDVFVQKSNPVAGAVASVLNCEVTAVGAWKQIEFAVLHGATAAEVDPCGKSMNPDVVPFDTKTGATYPPVSVVVTVVPLSMTEEFVGAPPAPPPSVSTFAFSTPEELSAVVLER
jgi:hypothetical protein